MGHVAVEAFVCVSCRGGDGHFERPGRRLFDTVTERLRGGDCVVTPVECLSVCKRPCTVALAASGKWTYVIGDLHHLDNVEDFISMIIQYAATDDGIVPWRERPLSFRKGVVSRVPPLGFHPAGA